MSRRSSGAARGASPSEARPQGRSSLSRRALALALAAAASLSAAEEDWPRVESVPEAEVTMYQPQLESFEGDRLRARAAVSILRTGATDPVFGAVWVEARVDTDRETREVRLRDVTVPDAKFPGVPEEAIGKLKRLLEARVPTWEVRLTIDDLVAAAAASEAGRMDDELGGEAPEIIVSVSPAILIVLDGDAELVAVEGTRLMRVVNTPYFMVLDGQSGAYWFHTGESWVTASQATGRWRDGGAPSSVVEYARKEGVLPSETPGEDGEAGELQRPQVLVRTRPAELVVIDGRAVYKPIRGTDLFYVDNTSADVLHETRTERHFVLLAGRWFVAPSLTGPWTTVAPDALPESFARIPEDSAMGHVLASVPGTDQAAEAVRDAQVPQTARVERDRSITVEYDGEPVFEPIAGTEVQYAVNTELSVLLIGGRYYCCHDAVWFEAASPTGPWTVCGEVPAEVATIPAECPHYHVKYVYVYETTPTYVWVGFTPGYLGCYRYRGVVVYGTGYWYRGWYRRAYYPRPVTYGFGARYNPYTGGWGFRVGYRSGGYYGGAVAVRGGWWGPAGYRDIDQRVGVAASATVAGRSTAVAATRSTAASGWARLADRRPLAASAARPAEAVARGPRPATGTPGAAPAARRAASPVATPRANNVYADRDGNVYRRTREGWERRTPSGWGRDATPERPAGSTRPATPATRPATRAPAARPVPSTTPNAGRAALERDYRARTRSTSRSTRRQSGATPRVSVRGGSGGGLRSGGLRRR